MKRPDELALYRCAPRSARLHLEVRWRLFDHRRLSPYIPPGGTFIDIGCGHGLWTFHMARARPDASVLGLDPDADKIRLAQQVAEANHITNVTFTTGRAGEMPLPRCTLASLIDMFYLIPLARRQPLLDEIAAALEPGGRLLLKDVDTRPRWKYAWNIFEETLAVRLLGITVGERLYFQPAADVAGMLEQAGLRAQVIPMHRGYLHPHVLLVGDKP